MLVDRVAKMPIAEKTIEIDPEALSRIKIAMNAKSEKEAINFVLKRCDTDIQLAEATSAPAGKMNIENLFGP
jgi:hypothetical protein